MAWTYIVECADGSYYVGSTTALERRIWEHNNDPAGAAYTRRRRPATSSIFPVSRSGVRVQRIDGFETGASAPSSTTVIGG